MSEKTKEKTKSGTSVTFPEDLRNWLVQFAEASGHTRRHPWNGTEEGNLSWAANEAAGFLKDHIDQYMGEKSAKLAEGLGGG